MSPILQFFWNISSQKSLKLYYASYFHYQKLASSPSFCKKQKILKIIKNLLIFTCLEQHLFVIFQKKIFDENTSFLLYLKISLPEVWTIQSISTWNQSNTQGPGHTQNSGLLWKVLWMLFEFANFFGGLGSNINGIISKIVTSKDFFGVVLGI